jgi:membrane protein implicated in regulation of membrane protease activity
MERPKLILVGLVVLLLPALFLAFVLAFLQFTEALVAAELSTLELVELYVIELVVFAVAIYLLYRVGLGVLGPPPEERSGDEPGRSGGER